MKDERWKMENKKIKEIKEDRIESQRLRNKERTKKQKAIYL